jgi:hypothetical protein
MALILFHPLVKSFPTIWLSNLKYYMDLGYHSIEINRTVVTFFVFIVHGFRSYLIYIGAACQNLFP